MDISTNIDLVHIRLRVYFKTPIDLDTLEKIVQNFSTSTTPPVPAFSKQNAIDKYTELHTDIESLISTKSLNTFKKYIKWTKAYQQKWMEAHMEITKELIESDEATRTEVEKVLGSVRWLINFYLSLTGNRKKNFFFEKLSYFLQDLHITLLVLMCLRAMGTEDTYLHRPTDLSPTPAYKITPYMVSPESDFFQILILKEMIRILGWDMPQNRSPEDLAAVIVEHFKPQEYGWPTKGVDGVLTVVKDQSRYITLRSPHLQKNFVAYKTKHQVETISIPKILGRIPEAGIDKDIKSVYDRLLKVKDDHPILRSREEHSTNPKARKQIIGHVYHVILRDMISFLDVKNIKFKGSWEIDTSDFLNVLGNVARGALLEKRENKIAATIEALAKIIGLRAYVSSIEGTVLISKTALIHEEVLFRLIAFRALLMCTLHISTPGVQQVARVLPKYAKDVRLCIQPPNEDERHLEIYGLAPCT